MIEDQLDDILQEPGFDGTCSAASLAIFCQRLNFLSAFFSSHLTTERTAVKGINSCSSKLSTFLNNPFKLIPFWQSTHNGHYQSGARHSPSFHCITSAITSSVGNFCTIDIKQFSLILTNTNDFVLFLHPHHSYQYDGNLHL